MSLRAFKVFSVPGATGDPLSAWRAAEITPMHTKVLGRSTRLVTLSCWVRLSNAIGWRPPVPLGGLVNNKRGTRVKSLQPLVIRVGLSNSMPLTI